MASRTAHEAFQVRQIPRLPTSSSRLCRQATAFSTTKVVVDQEKYILEEVQPLRFRPGRLSNKTNVLEASEFKDLRSLIYKLNWVGRETRPEVSGVASILASRLKDASAWDAICANKSVRHLRSTASKGLTIWKLDPSRMAFVSFSDAGGVGANIQLEDKNGLPADPTQGAWMVLATDKDLVDNKPAKVSILGWRSTKLKRKVPSTLAGETQALSGAVAEVEYLQVLYRDIVFRDVDVPDCRRASGPFTAVLRADCTLGSGRVHQVHVVDAKSIYDTMNKDGNAGSKDRRTALDIAIISEALERAQG